MPFIHTYQNELNRSSIVLAAANYWAKNHNRRVLIVDWDFYSPNTFLSFFPNATLASKTVFYLLHHFKSKEHRYITPDKIAIPRQQKGLEASVISAAQLEGNGCIDIIPEGRGGTLPTPFFGTLPTPFFGCR